MNVTRRRFALVAGTLAVSQLPAHGAEPLTAADAVKRIQTALGGEWPATSPDGLKAGDPNTTVKGIATTGMATVDVLKRAAAAGTNLVVTYEPTFFGRQDGAAPPPMAGPNGRGPGPRGLSPDDPVYKAKREFIEKNGLVIFRLRDHWQAAKENHLTAGLADALGWTKYQASGADGLYNIPASTAEDTVALIKKKLNLRGGLRAVGDRKAPVRRVLLYPGTMTPAVMWQRYSEVDLILAGEVREWENTHYAADMFTIGEKRNLVTIGRVASEDPGMKPCAAWMKSLFAQLPTQWLPAGDLYWRAV